VPKLFSGAGSSGPLWQATRWVAVIQIQVFTREPSGPAIELETSYGNAPVSGLLVWVEEKENRESRATGRPLFESDFVSTDGLQSVCRSSI